MYHDHSVHSGQTVVFTVYTTGVPLILWLGIVQALVDYGPDPLFGEVDVAR